MNEPSKNDIPIGTAIAIFGNALESSTKHGCKLLETIWTHLYGPAYTILQRKAEQKARAIDRAEEIESAKHETILTLLKRDEKAYLKLMTEQVEVRASARVHEENVRQHVNLEETIRTAYLIADKSEATPSEKPVDNDWFEAWKDGAKSFSSQDMQSIYAKILASEVQKPGSFSPQTLSTVKIISPADAKAFTTFGSNVWEFGPSRIPIPLKLDMKEPEPLNYLETQALIDLGLINRTLTPPSAQEQVLLIGYFGDWYFCSKTKKPNTSLSNYTLTRTGMELFPISGAMPIDSVKTRTLERFQKEGDVFEPVKVQIEGGVIVGIKQMHSPSMFTVNAGR